MPQLDTIKKRADFIILNNNAVRKVTNGIILLAGRTPLKRIELESGRLELCRFGITVTKKLSKKAVIRNKIRRRIREAARKILSISGKVGFDYVFIARNQILELNFAELSKEIERSVLIVNGQLI